VETDPAAAPIVLAHHGDDVLPTPDAVARFVADTEAGRSASRAPAGPAIEETRSSLAERLKPYSRDAPGG
jgi:hypothetical protein